MKAEELMIGDWVMYNPNVFNEDEYEPTKECFPTKINNGEDIDLAIEGCYTPIPITHEILERNGFYWGYPVDVEDMASNVFGGLSVEMPPKSWVWDEGAGVISITFPNESDGGEISCENGHCYFSFVFDNVIFVHQLQHALRLCRIPKNIEL